MIKLIIRYFRILVSLGALLWGALFASSCSERDASPGQVSTEKAVGPILAMPEVGEKRSHDEALPTSITDVDADSRELETDSSTDPIAEKLPPIAFPELISVSLEAMEKHGLDRSQPMPSKHRVVCETEAAAERVRAWAEANAFEPRPTEIFHLHGGVPMWGVDVVRTAVPDPQHIHDQARAIVSGIDTISGSEYTTWMGEYPDSP